MTPVWTRLAAASVATMAAVSVFPPVGEAVPPAVSTVAVVDFYAPTPVPTYPGVVPERFAADDLSVMLARAAGDRVALIPRATAERAEADLHWHADDVLRFARLGALAQTLHADRLVVGWVAQFVVGHEPNNEVVTHGGGPITGFALVVIQVFDAAEGRIVAETRVEGNGTGALQGLVAEQTLHEALQPAVPFLLSTLAPRTP